MKKRYRFSWAVLVWLLLASSVAYSLDLECFLEDNGICRQMCQEAADDPCSEPLHLSPPSCLPAPAFSFFFLPSIDRTGPLLEEQETVSRLSPGLLPVGLRAPPLFV